MICELTPYTDCTMNMDSATYTETAIRPKIYSVWKCDEYTELVEHEKYLPKCKQVVKQNCDTIWSVDPNGKKVGYQNVFNGIKFKYHLHISKYSKIKILNVIR